MPWATERVYKSILERNGQVICSSVLKMVPAQISLASNNEDILPRAILPPGPYHGLYMSKC